MRSSLPGLMEERFTSTMKPTQEFHLRGSYQIEKELVDALRQARSDSGWGAVGQAAVTTDTSAGNRYPR